MIVQAKIVPTPKEPKPPKRKRIWDNYKVVGEVQKSDRLKLVLAAAVRDGVKYINIREFYLRKKDLVWKPGTDGITVPINLLINNGEDMIFPFKDFAFYLQLTAKELEDMPLYDEANAIYYIKEDKANEN